MCVPARFARSYVSRRSKRRFRVFIQLLGDVTADSTHKDLQAYPSRLKPNLANAGLKNRPDFEEAVIWSSRISPLFIPRARLHPNKKSNQSNKSTDIQKVHKCAIVNFTRAAAFEGHFVITYIAMYQDR